MELSDGITHLRRPVEADAAAVVEAVQAGIDHLQPWMPWATDAYGPEQALEWITGVFDATEHRFVIVDGDRILGSCGVNRVDPLHRTGNLGYWLRPDAVGRGHATRATRLLAAHALGHDDIELVYIEMSTRNEPSRAVAERSGATYEGVLRSRLLLHGERHDVHVFTFAEGEI